MTTAMSDARTRRELHTRIAAHVADMPLHSEVIAQYCGEPARRLAVS